METETLRESVDPRIVTEIVGVRGPCRSGESSHPREGLEAR